MGPKKSTKAASAKADAPKTTTPKAEPAQSKDEKPVTTSRKMDSKHPIVETTDSKDDAAAAGDKRKRSTKDAPSSTPQKAARRSARTAPQAPPSRPIEVIKFLLSPASAPLYLHEDAEAEAEASHPGKDYFSSDLTPFEHLLCAAILSRPISHVLGQRTIRTVLNAPFDFTTPDKILDAGEERVHEAMEAARTQHRQKTAAELMRLAEAVVNAFGGVELDNLRGQELGSIRKQVKDGVKGMGNTAVDIFLRRVQGCEGWEGIYPYVDGKTAESLTKVGLPDGAEELETLIEEEWEAVKDLKALQAVEDKDAAKRRCFVLVVERALGIGLEGNEGEIAQGIDSNTTGDTK